MAVIIIQSLNEGKGNVLPAFNDNWLVFKSSSNKAVLAVVDVKSLYSGVTKSLEISPDIKGDFYLNIKEVIGSFFIENQDNYAYDSHDKDQYGFLSKYFNILIKMINKDRSWESKEYETPTFIKAKRPFGESIYISLANNELLLPTQNPTYFKGYPFETAFHAGSGVIKRRVFPLFPQTWTARSASHVRTWRQVTYGNGLFVAVASSGTNRVMTSPDGITWTAQSTHEANSWQGVTYGNGLFVAVAYSGTNKVMTSPDGITWTAQSTPEGYWNGVTYGKGLFVAVAHGDTNRVMTSPDGITWTAQSTPEANSWQGVTYGKGLFVAVAHSGTNRVMTSPDGITWTAQSTPEGYWNGVTYGKGLFVAVAYSGTNRVMTSPDGITWTAQSTPEANSWNGVTYGKGLFVAVAYSGTNRVMTSPDGITWTAQSTPEANSWQGVTYGNGLFVAVAHSGANQVMTLFSPLNYVEVDKKGIYLKWLNQEGGYSYHLFDPVFTEIINSKSAGTFINHFTTDQSNQVAKSYETGRLVEQRIKLKSQVNTGDDLLTVRSLYKSKEVYLYFGAKGSGDIKFLMVRLANGSHNQILKRVGQKAKVEIILPEGVDILESLYDLQLAQ